MMGTGRGTEASVLEGLIAFGKDPKAMAGRLEQLKAAQDAAQERIAKAGEVEAANAKRVDELDALMAELDKRRVALDQRQVTIEDKQTSLTKRTADLADATNALAVAKVAFVDEQKQAKANLAAERASLDKMAAEVAEREKMLDAYEANLDEEKQAISLGNADLAARESAFATRQEALKAALAGV